MAHFRKTPDYYESRRLMPDYFSITYGSRSKPRYYPGKLTFTEPVLSACGMGLIAGLLRETIGFAGCVGPDSGNIRQFPELHIFPLTKSRFSC